MRKITVKLDYLVVSKDTENIFQNIVEENYKVVDELGKYRIRIDMGRTLDLYIYGNRGNLPILIHDCIYPALLFIERLMEKSEYIEFYNSIHRYDVYYDLYELTRFKKLKKLFKYYIEPDLPKHYDKIKDIDMYLEKHPEWINRVGATVNLIPFVKFIQWPDKPYTKEISELYPILLKSPFTLEELSYHRFLGTLRMTFKNRKTKSEVEIVTDAGSEIHKAFIKKYKSRRKTIMKAILKNVKLTKEEFYKESGKTLEEWVDILLDIDKIKQLQAEDSQKFQKMFSTIHSLA